MEVLLWIGINALVGFALGKSKDMVGACVFISILLGPIGWLLAIFFDGNKKKCPECAEMIKKEAKVCRYCGLTVRKPVEY